MPNSELVAEILRELKALAQAEPEQLELTERYECAVKSCKFVAAGPASKVVLAKAEHEATHEVSRSRCPNHGGFARKADGLCAQDDAEHIASIREAPEEVVALELPGNWGMEDEMVHAITDLLKKLKGEHNPRAGKERVVTHYSRVTQAPGPVKFAVTGGGKVAKRTMRDVATAAGVAQYELPARENVGAVRHYAEQHGVKLHEVSIDELD